MIFCPLLLKNKEKNTNIGSLNLNYFKSRTIDTYPTIAFKIIFLANDWFSLVWFGFMAYQPL